MAFRIKTGKGACPADPESLLRDLRKKKIPGLLSHQADIIRSYLEIPNTTEDVALQLPTGSGKTLVGLLIAEWRRRKYGERTVYLCPTRQLVHQIASHASEKYGLDVLAFVGKKANYDKQAMADWQSADAVGITTYSSLFNVNPFFSDPNLIILDDAHSAENYISSLWSLQVDRLIETHKSTFAALVSVLAPLLPPAERSNLVDNTTKSDSRWIDKIPTPDVEGVHAELISLLDQYTANTDLSFSWQMIRGSLGACQVYVSAWSILIRPLVPPTNTHRPFASAKQRIYMSATLGAGGDLERITGRCPIQRVRVPTGWDKQGIGRRFFIFPQRSLEKDDLENCMADAIKLYGRSLFLVPDDRSSDECKKWVQETVGFPVFDATQIEESKSSFVESDEAVAVVANRYDGIDLVDKECRMILVKGLPRGANLQERFIVVRIGAHLLLDDRILTRVVQGFGRCTRSPNDYSAILVLGEDLQKYLMTSERRKFFHPEIQAELVFGLDQSRNTSSSEIIENLAHFLEQDDEWHEADDGIVQLREGLAQEQLPATVELAAAVKHEISYQYDIWHGNYTGALAHCRSVLAELTHEELRGYRALWLYLSGSAAWLAFKDGHLDSNVTACDYFSKAYQAAQGLRWLIRLQKMQAVAGETQIVDDGVSAIVERLEAVFDKLGTVQDQRYNKLESEIRNAISQTDDGKLFERGHEKLGYLIGYISGNSEDEGAPDPWWKSEESYCFVFEDYSEAGSESVLSVTKARQAASHPDWVKDRLNLDNHTTITPVLITSSRKTTLGAVPHLRKVRYWHLPDFQRWACNALAVIRELRRKYPGECNLGWRAEAANALRKANIGPTQLLTFLSKSAADEMSE